jgi:ribosomal protein S6
MATVQPSSEDVRVYECAILYPYPFNQKEENQLLKEIEEMFTDAGGKLVFKDAWGRRGLAYQIGGYGEANVVIYYYELEPKKLKEIDGQLRILKGVLRHLIVKPPKNYQIASYAGKFEQWKEDEKMAEERKVSEKEEKLKKQVLDKAKRQSAKPAKKEGADERPAKPAGDITQQLDKLISDKDLEI